MQCSVIPRYVTDVVHERRIAVDCDKNNRGGIYKGYAFISHAKCKTCSVLNEIALSIQVSYKQLSTWEKLSKNPHHQPLSLVGYSLTWSHVTLLGIGEDATLKPTARVNTEAFREPLLKYQTILTAKVFLRIFEHMSPLLKYRDEEPDEAIWHTHFSSFCQSLKWPVRGAFQQWRSSRIDWEAPCLRTIWRPYCWWQLKGKP